MGHCHCRNQRLLSPSRKALPHAKSRLDCHRRHLDAMVLHHKTPEFTVRFVPFFIISLPLPPLFFYIYIFLPYPLTYLTLTSKKKNQTRSSKFLPWLRRSHPSQQNLHVSSQPKIRWWWRRRRVVGEGDRNKG